AHVAQPGAQARLHARPHVGSERRPRALRDRAAGARAPRALAPSLEAAPDLLVGRLPLGAHLPHRVAQVAAGARERGCRRLRGRLLRRRGRGLRRWGVAQDTDLSVIIAINESKVASGPITRRALSPPARRLFRPPTDSSRTAP